MFKNNCKLHIHKWKESGIMNRTNPPTYQYHCAVDGCDAVELRGNSGTITQIEDVLRELDKLKKDKEFFVKDNESLKNQVSILSDQIKDYEQTPNELQIIKAQLWADIVRTKDGDVSMGNIDAPEDIAIVAADYLCNAFDERFVVGEVVADEKANK